MAKGFVLVWRLLCRIMAMMAHLPPPGSARDKRFSLIERLLVQAERLGEDRIWRLACIEVGREDLIDIPREERAHYLRTRGQARISRRRPKIVWVFLPFSLVMRRSRIGVDAPDASYIEPG